METAHGSIGQLVERLFPQGFQNGNYLKILRRPNNNGADKTLNRMLSINSMNHGHSVKIEPDYFSGFGPFRNFATSIGEIIKEATPNSLNVRPEHIFPPLCPFDMFAVASLLLSRSGAYYHFESSLEDIGSTAETQSSFYEKIQIGSQDRKTWRKLSDAWKNIHEDKKSWKILYESDPHSLNHNITYFWKNILAHWNFPIFEDVSEIDPIPKWWRPALALLAISDGASADVGFKFQHQNSIETHSPISIWAGLCSKIIDATKAYSSKLDREISTFHYVESISIADKNVVAIVPKSKTAPLGCTLRCLSHNLAQLPGRGIIRVGWAWAQGVDEGARKNPIFNFLLIPYPYEIHSTHFAPVAVGENGETQKWGAFRMKVNPDPVEDKDFVVFVGRLIQEAERKIGTVHGIVLPELAVSRNTILALRDYCVRDLKTIELLCAGVRERLYEENADGSVIPANGAYMATFRSNGKERHLQHEFFHEKHHRWRITEQQIFDYDLAPSLDPSRVWWEDLRIRNRRLPFIVMRDKWTVTSLICEDLARNDPARTVVESVGPNLVISLLMDGPQIPRRWSARYATVLAEDPGSSVLSMSSLGLIRRSNRVLRRKNGAILPPVSEKNEAYSIALWRDDKNEKQIELEEGNHAVVISVTQYPVTDYTMDGRADDRTVSLRHTATRQIKVPGRDTYPPWDK